METQVKEYEGERVQEPQAPAHPLALAPSHSESPKEESIELRSEGVQELMGRIPSWTVRYGISVIALVVVLLLGLAALIRWPDVVAGTGVLTNADPPREVVARTAGRLVALHVQDGTHVVAGDPLAVIESAATPSAVDSLRGLLPALHAVRIGSSDSLPALGDLALGDGRTAWSTLRTALHELVVWRKDPYRAARNAALEKKVEHFRRMITSTEAQLSWGRKKLANHAQEARIDTALAGKGVIAATEHRRGQNTFLEQQMSLSALEASQQQQHIALIELQERLYELQHTDAATERELNARALTALNTMEGFLNDWELGHELVAPIAGVVHYRERLSPQQPLAQGKVLFLVVPPDSTFLVEAMLPMVGSGKVQVGQPVHVDPEGYPRAEYGRLIGTVSTLATTPGDQGYRVSIALPKGLETSFHRTLPFKPEMPVRVEVVTQSRSALGRVFATLRGVTDR